VKGPQSSKVADKTLSFLGCQQQLSSSTSKFNSIIDDVSILGSTYNSSRNIKRESVCVCE